jgi:hypothetical protein
MMSTRLLFSSIFLVAAAVACSSSSSGGSSDQATSCQNAKVTADNCNNQPSDGGAKITVNFDEAKCESGGAQAKTAADCITANKTNCSCVLSCSLKGTCP